MNITRERGRERARGDIEIRPRGDVGAPWGALGPPMGPSSEALGSLLAFLGPTWASSCILQVDLQTVQ